MLTDEEIAAYLEVGNESRALEYKGYREAQSAAYIAKVARAAMALSNQRDGGYIVLGVDDAEPMSSDNGLHDEDADLWLSVDWTADKLNKFADPPLDLRIEERRHPRGGRIVLIHVSEFSEIPTLCQSDSIHNIVKVGQLYTRSLRKPESTSYHTQNEVREVLDLAVAKGLRRYVETGQAVGVNFGLVDETTPRFAHEVESLLRQEMAQELTSRPHFRYTIHPQSYEPERVPHADLRAAVEASAVRLRGWPFPFVLDPLNDSNFVYEVTERQSRREGWAMFTSGLFLATRQIGDWPEDWEGHVGDSDRVQGNLPVWMPLTELTEAFEFATRLRRHLGQEEPMVIRFEGHDLKGQRLIVANRNRSGFFENYIYSGKTWQSQDYIVDATSAVEGTRGLAVEATLQFLVRFGWRGVTASMLEGMQQEIFDR